MHRLCLVRLLKPEGLIAASQQYVAENLGPQFVAPLPPALSTVWKESNNATPVIFILSSGTKRNKTSLETESATKSMK